MSNHQKHSLAALSFAESSPTGAIIGLWRAPHSGTIADCNREGRRRADELVEYLGCNDTPFVFGHVVRAISETRQWGPMEIAFFQRIGSAVANAHLPEEICAPTRPCLSLVKG